MEDTGCHAILEGRLKGEGTSQELAELWTLLAQLFEALGQSSDAQRARSQSESLADIHVDVDPERPFRICGISATGGLVTLSATERGSRITRRRDADPNRPCGYLKDPFRDEKAHSAHSMFGLGAQTSWLS